MKYPRLTHDQKISTKLSQKEVTQIRNDYLEIPDYKIYAEMYGVSQNCIRYWVDDDYKKKKLASNKKGKQKRYQEIKKRKHDLDLAYVSLKKRVERYPKIKAWRIKAIKESNDKK